MLLGLISHYFFGLTIFFTSLFLVLLVLVQRGRGGGIAGALGGAGGQSAFGTKAGDLFTRITVGVAVLWILLCCGAILVLKTPEFSTGVTDAKKGSTGATLSNSVTGDQAGSGDASKAALTTGGNEAAGTSASGKGADGEAANGGTGAASDPAGGAAGTAVDPANTPAPSATAEPAVTTAPTDPPSSNEPVAEPVKN